MTLRRWGATASRMPVLAPTLCIALLVSGCQSSSNPQADPDGPFAQRVAGSLGSDTQDDGGDAASGSRTGSIVDLSVPRPGDHRQQRVIELDNGLEAWLISDPDCKKSAAALDVNVGSLEDPWEHLGLAHFLEHMLFLGTDKYPEVEEYSRYLATHQGMSNAYTTAERTNFFFEVDHNAFEGALDRFAQFFIAPRFDAKFVEREMNAVNSEHQKNLNDDYWRTRMIQRGLHRDGHPRQKFSTGDLKTLANVTRDELIAFYEKYYSANVMKLCVLSNAPLDSLEKWTRQKFSAIENHHRNKIVYSSDVWDSKALPQLISVRPVGNVRQLQLSFVVPPTIDYWASKPGRLLGALIGNEGEGSLLSELKAEDLATSLSAGAKTESYAGYFDVTIGLTEKGRAHYERVIELFFSYVQLLKREGLRRYFYDDFRKMTELEYYFRDHEEGGEAVSGWAAGMQRYPAATLEYRQSVLSKFDPSDFELFLSAIQASKMRATLTAADVECDRVQPNYGAEYSVTRIPDATSRKWQDVAIHPSFAYPEPNPYVPSDVSILTRKEPINLLPPELGVFWFEQDLEFGLPKASVSILLESDKIAVSPKARLLTKLGVRAVREGINEWSYPAVEAGLAFSIQDEALGIRLEASGYAHRLPSFLLALAQRLKNIEIDEKTFRALKSELSKELDNNDYAQAYSQAFYDFTASMAYPAVHRDAYRAMVGDVTLAEVREFYSGLFDAMSIRGVGYGNLLASDLKSTLLKVLDVVADRPLPPERRLERRYVKLPSGDPLAIVKASKSNNNVWLRVYQFGTRTPHREAVLRCAEALLKTGFYGEMRTKQQLGYVVFSGSILRFDEQGMYFLIQSGTHSAGDCAGRALTYLQTVFDALAKQSDRFDAVKAAIVSELKQPEKDMAQRMDTLAKLGVAQHGDFGYTGRVIDALEQLTLADVIADLRTAFDASKMRSITFYIDASGNDATVPKERLIENTAAFKED